MVWEFQSIVVGKACMVMGAWVSGWHCICSLEAERGQTTVYQSVLLLFPVSQSGYPIGKMVPLASRVGPPSSVKLLCRCPHRQHAQRCVSSVIPNAVQLTMKTNGYDGYIGLMGTYDSCIYMHTSTDALFVFTSVYIKLNMTSWWWPQF